MKRKITISILIVFIAVALYAVGVWGQPGDLTGTGDGWTNYTSVGAEEDMYVGDDLRVIDDVQVDGDLTIIEDFYITGMVYLGGGLLLPDDTLFLFGDDSDASMEYDENGTNQLRITGDTIFEDNVELGTSLDLDYATASEAVATDGSKNLVSVTGVSAAEVGYLADVTGLLQAQLDLKAPLDDPQLTTSMNLAWATVSEAVCVNGTNDLVSQAGVSCAELGYLSTLSSDVQTQMDLKAPLDDPQLTTSMNLAWATASEAVCVNGTNDMVSQAGVSCAELGYLADVTSAIQAQLDLKIDDPGAVTDHAVVRWDGVTGYTVQNSTVTIGDNGEIAAGAGAGNDAITIGTSNRGVYMTGDYESAIKVEGGEWRRGLMIKETLDSRPPDAGDDSLWGVQATLAHQIDASAHFIGSSMQLTKDAGDAFQVLPYEGAAHVSSVVNRVAGLVLSTLVTEQPDCTSPNCFPHSDLAYVGAYIYQHENNTIAGEAGLAIQGDWDNSILIDDNAGAEAITVNDARRGLYMVGDYESAIKVEGGEWRRGIMIKETLDSRPPDASDDSLWGVQSTLTHQIDNGSAHAIGIASSMLKDSGDAFQVLAYEGAAQATSVVNRVAGIVTQTLVTEQPDCTNPNCFPQTSDFAYVGHYIFQHENNTIAGEAGLGIQGDWDYGVNMKYGTFTGGDILMQNEETISNATDGHVAISGSVGTAKFTSDPCGSLPEGAFWYNDTNNIMCYCDHAGADLKFSSDGACF